MGKNWAITIGINQYQFLQPLRFAKQDAEAVQNFLINDLNIDQTYHFTEDAPSIPQDHGPDLPSKPTYGTLRRFLRTRFELPFLGLGDNLWFFFAGHGIRHEERDYLMPIDGDPGDVENTALSIHYVTDALRRSGAGNVMMFVDACRSQGRRAGLGVGGEEQQGVISIFSCSPAESSYEIEDLQQGAFTYMLLQGLRLQGEGNCATVERLYHYLRRYVPELNAAHQKPRQTPYGVVEPPTKYHLILLPRQANLTDITTLKNDALSAEIKSELELAKQYWIRVLAVSPADPEAIDAIGRIAQKKTAFPPASPLPAPPAPSAGTSRDAGPIPTQPSDPPVTEPSEYRKDSVASGASSQSSPSVTLPAQLPIFRFEVITVNASGEIINRQPGQAEYRTEDLGKGIKLTMVAIPGGSFQMGSPKTEEDRYDAEGPQHEVTLKPFWMGKYPITQAQWRQVATFPKVDRDLASDPANFKGDNRPVEQVSWHDAIEFCARLTQQSGHDYRLPSEAEWEYACRAGTTTPFHFGETLTSEFANYNASATYGSGPKGDYRKQTTDVGIFPPNAYGLYDLHGNVWEWCLDHWQDGYGGFFRKAPTDGSAWVTGGNANSRMLRGRSWD